MIQESAVATWEQAPAVGDGEEFRSEFNGSQASALMAEDVLVHGSVLAGR